MLRHLLIVFVIGRTETLRYGSTLRCYMMRMREFCDWPVGNVPLWVDGPKLILTERSKGTECKGSVYEEAPRHERHAQPEIRDVFPNDQERSIFRLMFRNLS